MAQQTAVNWLVKQLPLIQQEGLRDIIEQAKLMEREQIENAYMKGNEHESFWPSESANKYYNETYGK